MAPKRSRTKTRAPARTAPHPKRRAAAKKATKPAKRAAKPRASAKTAKATKPRNAGKTAVLKTAPMQVVEVTHLPEAASGSAAPAPGKEEPLVLETAHQHVTMEGGHSPAKEEAPALPDAIILAVRVRSWFSALANQDVALYIGDALKGRQTTDNRGEARFGGLAPGEYRVEVVRGKTVARRVNVSKSRSLTVRFW